MDGIRLYQFNEHVDTSIEHIVKSYGIPSTVIELGVFQGYFTLNMTQMAAEQNSNYKHYAIDPYDKSDDLEGNTIQEAHQQFLKNMSLFDYKNNIEFIRKKSWDGMIDLLNRGVKADLIYVDGDHKANTVLEDMVLGFKLLKVGGVMLCDDSVTWCYTDKNGQKPNHYSPRLAVESFIQCNWAVVEPIILPNGYQTAFIKRGE